MKKKFILDLELGEKLANEQFALKNLSKKTTKNGDEYWDLKLSDKSGEISAKVWNNALDSCDNQVKDGDIIEIDAKVEAGLNGQGLQIFISAMNKALDFKQQDFLASSKRDIEDLWTELNDEINQIQDKFIQKLLISIFADKDFLSKYQASPAAELAHHDFIGGLMQHSLEMLAAAKSMFSFYPKINQDIVIAGIFLHDIGKVFELSVDASINRTESGHLLGHIYQGAAFVGKYMDKIPDFPEKWRNQILHIILSHHGSLEFGSPILPQSIEAYLVNLADMMSSKLQIVTKIIENNKNNSSQWSAYNNLVNTKIYLNNEDQPLEMDNGKTTNNDFTASKKSNNSSSNNLELPF